MVSFEVIYDQIVRYEVSCETTLRWQPELVVCTVCRIPSCVLRKVALLKLSHELVLYCVQVGLSYIFIKSVFTISITIV